MWKRKCPNCKKILIYTTKKELNRAAKKRSLCRSCSLSGKNNPNFEKKLSKKVRKKISESMKGKNHPNWGKKMPNQSQRMTGENNPMYGKKHDKNTKIIMSKIKLGKNNPFYDKKHDENYLSKVKIPKSDIVKKNMRLAAIKRIKEHYGQIMPNYNPSSIQILEEKAKELGITDLMHAENGGEFYIKKLGYWVDGYSKEKNIVIEYYEKHHENQTEKDKKRKQEIIDYLGCKVIEIKERKWLIK